MLHCFVLPCDHYVTLILPRERKGATAFKCQGSCCSHFISVTFFCRQGSFIVSKVSCKKYFKSGSKNLHFVEGFLMCVCVHVQRGLHTYICVSVLQSGIDFRENINKIMQLPSLTARYWCIIARQLVLIDSQPEVKMPP